MPDKNDFPPEIFIKIFDKHHLGLVHSIKPLTGGFANPAFLVNNTYVIRFHTADEAITYDPFMKESILYPLFTSMKIPAPKCIALNTKQDILPYYYIIISYLPGEPMSTAYAKLSQQDKAKIAFETGTVLRNIHEITETDIKIHNELFKTKASWKDRIIKEFTQYYEQFNLHKNELDSTIRKEIEILFEQFKENITDSDIPKKLLHYDFHAHHVLIDQNSISGFIDFELSCFGDPLWDFQKLPINLSIEGDFFQDEFLKGYGITKFTDNELLRFKMYCVLQGIWQIDNTRYGNINYPKGGVKSGYSLIEKALNY